MSPEKIQLEELNERELRERLAYSQDHQYGQQYSQGYGNIGGQPLAPIVPQGIPPSLDKETMDLYLKVHTPEDIDKLEGWDRLWLYKNDETSREIQFGNANAHQVKTALRDLQIAIDFQGCDNVENLIFGTQLRGHGQVLWNRARSDLSDGIRERLVPSIGWSIGESKLAGGGHAGERPKESRALFGLLNRNR